MPYIPPSGTTLNNLTSPMAVVWNPAVSYTYCDPPPLIDHAHNRPHHYRRITELLLHKHTVQPFGPDVDIRETEDTFYVAVELPGLRNKNAVTIQYTTSHHLTISGCVEASFEGKGNTTKLPAETENIAYFANQLHHEKSLPKIDAAAEAMEQQHLLVGERKTGPFRRQLYFPVEMEMENMSAKLEHGLLEVMVPKKRGEGVKRGIAKIE